MGSEVSRRRFVQILAALSTASTLPAGAAESAVQTSLAGAPKAGDTVNRKNLVATQVKAYAWQDEGIDALLDNLQEKGNVNTAFAFTFNSEATDRAARFRCRTMGLTGKPIRRLAARFTTTI